jgi:hypothetical protein
MSFTDLFLPMRYLCVSQRATKYTVMFGPTIFLFLIFCAMKLPAYSGIPLAIGLFFGMHHVSGRGGIQL